MAPSGGVLVATMGAQDSPDDVEDDWLGAPMFFSHYGAKKNRALVRQPASRSRWLSSRSEPEDRHAALFLWVIARRPPDGRSMPDRSEPPIPAPRRGRCPSRHPRRHRRPGAAEYPNESCGVIIGDAPAGRRRPRRALRADPEHQGVAVRYEIDPIELLHLNIEAERPTRSSGASSTRIRTRPAVPRRPTSVVATIYVEPLYLLVSLDPEQADPVTGDPASAAWRIVDGERSMRSSWDRAVEPADPHLGRSGARRGGRGRGDRCGIGRCRLLDAIVHPPAIIRAALVGASVGHARGRPAVTRPRPARGRHGRRPGSRPRRALIFLALAALAAAAGWVRATPCPRSSRWSSPGSTWSRRRSCCWSSATGRPTREAERRPGRSWAIRAILCAGRPRIFKRDRDPGAIDCLGDPQGREGGTSMVTESGEASLTDAGGGRRRGRTDRRPSRRHRAGLHGPAAGDRLHRGRPAGRGHRREPPARRGAQPAPLADRRRLR